MIIHALETAIALVFDEEYAYGWSDDIESVSVSKAKVIMDYIIKQKFSLMRKEIVIEDEAETSRSATSGEEFDSRAKYTSKFLSFNKPVITASDVSQFRLMPPSQTSSKNKYPVRECKSFMREISDAGFGSLEEVQKEGCSRSLLTFRKRRYSDLNSSQQDKKLRLTEEEYSLSFPSTSSSDDSFMLQSAEISTDDETQAILTTPEN